MESFKEYLLRKSLQEGNELARLYDHTLNGYIIMSVWKDNDDPMDAERNKERTELFKKVLQKNNMGYKEVDGVYTYDSGYTSEEDSFIIPYNKTAYESFHNQVARLKHIIKTESYIRNDDGNKDNFNQECILIATPLKEAGGVSLWYPSTDQEAYIGYTAQPNQTGDAYTKFKKSGKTFTIRDYTLQDTKIWNLYAKKKQEMIMRKNKSHKFSK